MSTSQNIKRNVLSTNPLRTNFNSNQNIQKNKSQTQKRFSNISKQKQTIQKNNVRFHQEINMQDSATILPQKNSARTNICVNQNMNYPIGTRTQNPQSMGPTLLWAGKNKSPSQKTRPAELVIKTKPALLSGNNPTRGLPSTERDRPLKAEYMLKQQDRPKPPHKIKSMLLLNKPVLNHKVEIDSDLICNEEMDFSHSHKHSRNFSNYNLKPQGKTSGVDARNFLQNSPQESIQPRGQKKYLPEKSVFGLEKTKSENAISFKPATDHQFREGQYFQKNPINDQSGFLKHTKPAPTLLSLEEELKRFSLTESQINLNAEAEAIIQLEKRQRDYLVQPNYIQIRQKNFNWKMRAILMGWMVEVCCYFGFKRQTYYTALALTDKYLEKINDLPKSEFQLVGAAAMFIASKLEEFEAQSSANFSKSTQYTYSEHQIKQMQLKITKSLNYEINPPTLFMWANRFMVHWDTYLEQTNATFHPYFDNHKPKYFKKQDQESYLMFREMMQMLDCSILDIQTLQFSPKILVFSFMYLILGKNYKQWSNERIVKEFPRSSHYLISQEKGSCFNHLFHMFLADSFEIELIDLLPAIQYCSTYFSLQLNFDPPSIVSKNGQQYESDINLQEYESFQTYHGKMLSLVCRRERGVL